ncbi:DUF3833 domain-containing protein [Alteromonas sp. ASW11-130]|uniref:DUF3833 domain-containing protein n=1 Tax=Alteromonas sp. ASW11-130 TaxID=3015775 RepID=UPI00224278F9|nr:DUF3833 domain-containing protein [Alteromonas sp. ASW11-130]MCW8091785.1 DUF3833 domain-containing protein [Alteromonas sp. ASW11-130]
MNKAFLCVLLALTLLIEGCGSSMEGEQYEKMGPELDLFTFFNSNVKAWGIVQNRSGNVVQRFTVDIKGSVRDTELVLEESFTYHQGKGPTSRTWRIKKISEDKFTGKANDIPGDAIGTSHGNAFHFTYQMDLPVEDDTYNVVFDDWFFAIDDQTLINRSYIRKFGLVMAEVTIFMRQRD